MYFDQFLIISTFLWSLFCVLQNPCLNFCFCQRFHEMPLLISWVLWCFWMNYEGLLDELFVLFLNFWWNELFGLNCKKMCFEGLNCELNMLFGLVWDPCIFGQAIVLVNFAYLWFCEKWTKLSKCENVRAKMWNALNMRVWIKLNEMNDWMVEFELY